MTWEEWHDMTQLMIDFYNLTADQRFTILLLMDGLKYRQSLDNNGDD